ncbi:MAG: hypothetical protein WCJ30_03140 [Deltaproteobacteria bacterium]
MPIGAPKDLTQCRRFFEAPDTPRQRQYEALRAFYLEGKPSAEVAATFGYTPGSFRVLCHEFRRDDDPQFFAKTQFGPRTQPKKTLARETAIALRKINYSVYDIQTALRERKLKLSPTAIREILKEDGFAPLPRRLDEERPEHVGPSVEPVADVRTFSLTPRTFATRLGGLFLLMPDLVKLKTDALAEEVALPGSKMIPAGHALRSCLALKLWSIERKSHVMALVADEGLALFAGLNVIPKKSYLSEYSSAIDHTKTMSLLEAWNRQRSPRALFEGASFNLDFHSIPYYGEHPVVQRHFVAMRSRRQPSILVFVAQDADGQAFCYSNADIRKGEEADEIIRFVEFWKRTRGRLPRHLVFDSKLTNQPQFAKLDDMGITFITLRRRSPKLLAEAAALPASAWRTIELDVAGRKFKHPRVYERPVEIEGHTFRQFFIEDLGHEEPTLLVTNAPKTTTAVSLITRYAQRMLIENALSDAVRFFHADSLSSTVGLKVDFDLALLAIASGLYRTFARRMRGYADAQARNIFRDLVDMPAEVTIGEHDVTVRLQRRAHLPIIVASGILDTRTAVPWWGGRKLRLVA